MTKGKRSEVGATRVSPNGYHYTRTELKWELTHRIIAEKALGRELKENERIRFLDGDRTNLAPENIEVYEARPKTANRKRAEIQAKIADLQAQLAELDSEE